MRTNQVSRVAATLALLTASLAAQGTVYDHFTSAKVKQSLWFHDGAPVSQANSRLRFDVPAVHKEENRSGVITTAGFLGDFVFVLDFDNLNVANKGGEAGLALLVTSIENPTQSENTVSIELAGRSDANNKPVLEFNSWLEKGGSFKKVSVPITTGFTAGQLRLIRKSGTVAAAFRVVGQAGWTTVASWPNAVTNVVDVELFAWCGEEQKTNTGRFAVDCDKLTYTAVRRAGAVPYGVRCQNLLAFPGGLPHVGNSKFGFGVLGGPKMANAPLLLILGFSTTPISLSIVGAPGCFLNTDLLFQLGMPALNKEGESYAPLPIPNDPKLIGVAFSAQLAALARLNNFGYSLSNGLRIKVIKL